MKEISIVIPCYEYKGKGNEVLEYSLEMIEKQTFKKFDVIISDDSSNDDIKFLCIKWSKFLDIKYYKNPNKKGTASNLNNAISKVTSEFIKLLDQDDYFYNEYSLEKIIDHLDKKSNWLVSAYFHTKDRVNYFRYHLPSLNNLLCIVNTIGTCSGVTLRNIKNMPLFDTNLVYAHDNDFYWRFWHQSGDPIILEEPTICNYLHENSVTSGVNQELINKETKYILDKYKIKYE